MPLTELSDYPHLVFRRCWKITNSIAISLGRCTAMIECIGSLPIVPQVQVALRAVALERGAQATTAIEGNTLSDDELRQVIEGSELPESRKYQAREVTNVLGVMTDVWKEVVQNGTKSAVSVQMLCKFNKQIGSNLGALYDGAPGKLRKDRRTVARYLAPSPEHVEPLLNDFCQWLKDEFKYHKGEQGMEDAIVQAIVAHIFFEWIHPFADGNGRTGRLLEFYILLRAGLPDITAHVLANHYNESRGEYTAHFDNARKKRDLTEFLAYAIQGFTDGLKATLSEAQQYVVMTVWRELIFQVFSNYTDYNKKAIFVRRRDLALAMPLNQDFTLFELVRTSDALTEQYMSHDKRVLAVDAKVLESLNLMVKVDDEKYRANSDQLMSRHVVRRAKNSPRISG